MEKRLILLWKRPRIGTLQWWIIIILTVLAEVVLGLLALDVGLFGTSFVSLCVKRSDTRLIRLNLALYQVTLTALFINRHLAIGRASKDRTIEQFNSQRYPETMPPKKKRKTPGDGQSAPVYMWLLCYEGGDGYDEKTTNEALFSTKQKAVDALPHLMDAHSMCGYDWDSVLEDLEKEDYERDLGFEWFGDSIGKEGGVLLTNEDSDRRFKVTVCLKRMRVDPPEPEIKRDEEESESLGTGLWY